MVEYRVIVKDQNDDKVGEFVGLQHLVFGKRLNNYGTAEFKVAVNDPKNTSLISLRRYTIWIYRQEDGVSTLLWSGEQALRKGTLDKDSNNWATIYAYDWLEQLNSRYTGQERTFDGVNEGEIAWTLIVESQAETNGNLGFTQGDNDTVEVRDRTYYNQNIMEAIINLSGVLNGFDFMFDNFRAFHTLETIGIDRTDTIFLQYGHNMTNVDVAEDFSNPVNRAIVLGQVSGLDSLTRVDRDDTDLQAIYKLREGRITEMSVSENQTLEQKGDALIRKYGTSLLKIDIDLTSSLGISIDDFSIGDLIRVKIKDGFYDIDATYRIFEWEVSYTSDNHEKLNLVLGNFTL